MATPTVRSVHQNSATQLPNSITTGAGTAIGDYLVCFNATNYYDASGITAPTGTAGTWTLHATGDQGTNNSHIKVYSRIVTVGGAQTVTCTPQIDEECFQFTYVISGVATINDGAAGGQGAATTTQLAPSVSPTGTDDLFLCAIMGGEDVVNYTAPGSMTDKLEEETATFGTLVTAREVLTASGATGTRTFTSSASHPYAACSIAIKGASAGATSLVPYLPNRRYRHLLTR